jgi:putative aldouronate transport system permease protein
MVGRRRPLDVIFTSLILVSILLICFVFVFPFIYTISLSLSDSFHILAGKVLFYPKGINVSSYMAILSDKSMVTAFLFTVKLTVLGVVTNLVMTTLAAFPLSRRDLKGRKLILAGVMLTWYFDGGLIPTYLWIKRLGLLDTIWSLILPEAISIYLLIITITYFRNIPHEMEEAAVVEGCSLTSLLLKIVLPLSTPIIATLTIFYAVRHWNEFFGALIYISSPAKHTLQLRLQIMLDTWSSSLQSGADARQYGRNIVPQGIKAAAIVFASAPIIIVYPLLQRYFIKGVMIGAVKG